MRESLAEWLGNAPGLRCVGAYATAEEALRRLPAENPDVVLMDINLPGMSGVQCVSRLKQLLPTVQVLILTTYDDGDLIFDSLRRSQWIPAEEHAPGGVGGGRAAGAGGWRAHVTSDSPKGY